MKKIEIINPLHLARLFIVFGMLVFANAPAATKDFTLHQAVLDDDKQLVVRLLNKGAAIDVIGSRKYGYGSALHLAVREGNLEIAKSLLRRGAEVDVLDPDDFTPLHNAAWNGNLEMTELLLDAGADINASTYDGDTPLSLAQKNDQAQVAEFIQTRLQASSVVDAKVESVPASDSGVIDISGTYIADISGDSDLLKALLFRSTSTEVRKVIITQNGSQITGTYDDGKGKIYGDIEGDTIEFYWTSTRLHGGGYGKWTHGGGNNELVGRFGADTGGFQTLSGKWKLTKIEAPSATDPGVIDISGTYSVDITGNKNRAFQGTKKRTKLVLKMVQKGSEITGSYGDSAEEQTGGILWGELEGNTIKFSWENFIGVSGVGIWTLDRETNQITGTWNADNPWYGEGTWDLERVK